jgi:predicted phosphodiesterase
MVRIAAAGDLHASEATRDRVERAFATVAAEADVILLAGDLTTTGEPEQAQVVADACRDLDVPVFAVLGNHDFHAGRSDELTAIVEAAGVVIVVAEHGEDRDRQVAARVGEHGRLLRLAGRRQVAREQDDVGLVDDLVEGAQHAFARRLRRVHVARCSDPDHVLRCCTPSGSGNGAGTCRSPLSRS